MTTYVTPTTQYYILLTGMLLLWAVYYWSKWKRRW
jgi:hypothetical protein